VSLIDFSWPELVSYERFLAWPIRIVNFRSVWVLFAFWLWFLRMFGTSWCVTLC